MKKYIPAIFLSVMFLAITAFTIPKPEAAAVEEPGIQWMSWEEMAEAQKTEPKKVFIDVYTDWCGWCKQMDKTTFKDKKVVEELQANYYAVKFDGEYKETITFKEQEFKFVASGKRGYHELAAALLNGQLSYPTVVFLDEELNMIQPLSGYRQAGELTMILNYIGEDHHIDTDWATFQTEYQQAQ